MLNSYLKRIFEVAKHGDAREESYYSGLEELIKNYAESVGKKKTHTTTLPKKTEAGNPDFRIWDGQQHIIGYIEAKPPTEDNLDHIEETEQLKRYRHTFPNLILTNFFEFRLYRDGQLVERVQIARPFIVHKLKTIPPVEKVPEFLNLLEQFFAFSLPKSYSAKTLAIELAKRTRFLKDQVIAEELKEETEKGTGHILGFYEAFQKHLISGLTKEDFADLYAQTIAYGLFAARTRSENGFSRKLAFDFIPPTIGILRDVFRFISMGDLPRRMEWIVDDISQVLAVADVKQILHKYFHEGKGKDPIIHFYETFLAEYDPEERERRGVYYTPEPVVSYITRSLHAILKDYFNRADGFATKSVTVLDPAGGTLTFPAEASKLAVAEFVEKYGSGGRSSLIENHILKNFYAFELMMASYAVGHLKMSFLLEELGYQLKKEDRFKLYLTNTLEMEELAQSKLPGMSSLAEESKLAGRVKKETPILVVLGNPPYSGHSSNIGDWISKEIKTYYQVDGKPLGEKNPKWLQDDYVKFIRFAQWKIDQAGEGVLGFITNHSYLDNPTFRGMRQSLMTSFDHMYLLDLHGNSLKKERCPDGSEDKNVFDIRQGVAIGLFIKKKGLKKKIVHAERWGLREEKYKWLLKNDLNTTKWKPIKPKSGGYLFVPRDERALDRYEQYPKVTEIFPINSVGIVTSRDSFVIDFDKEALKRRIEMFRDMKKMPDDIIRQTFGLKDKTNWKLELARKKVAKDEEWDKAITKILYRPFDEQWIFYHDEVIERSRKEVMRHMMQENFGLILPRRVELEGGWQHALATDRIVEHVAVSLKTIDYVFPLYLYQDAELPKKGRGFGTTMMLFESETPYQVRSANLDKTFVETLSNAYGKKATPEEIFYYIYAVLYADTYRTRYAEFLKTDFPRVPFTKNHKLFLEMGKFGKQLVELHLLKAPALEKPAARFQGKGDNRMEKQRYDENERRVYINASQYFEGIEKDVWDYQIGGYQVLDKWLKDRKSRVLSLDEIRHYCRIATALKKTIEIQAAINRLYPEIESDTLPVKLATTKSTREP
jgi:hypothetical protein